MLQEVRDLLQSHQDSKPDNLMISRLKRGGGRADSPKLSADLHRCPVTNVHHTRTINKCSKKF